MTDSLREQGLELKSRHSDAAHTLTTISSTTTIYPSFSLPHEIAFVTVICSAQLLTQAALAEAIAPLHIIGDYFGSTSTGHLSWYAAGYSLTVGTFILIAGRLGDMYGHKIIFVLGFLWFAAWSLVTGTSWYSTETFYIVCRTLQGIGPAFLLPSSLAIIGRTYPAGPRKNLVFCLFGATAPNGFTLGAVFSSLFGQFVWWPWTYWVMAIVCFLLAVVGYFVIPNEDDEAQRLASKQQSFDFGGAVTGVTGLVLVNVACNQGPSVGWGSPSVYVVLALGLVSMAAFFVVESRIGEQRQPLLPFEVLNVETGLALSCIVAGWSSFGIWLFYLWNFLVVLRHQSPLLTSAQWVTPALGGAVASLTTAYLLPRIGTRVIMMLSMVSFCAAITLLVTMPVQQTYWAQTFVSSLIAPWGMDMSFPAATIMLSSAVSRRHQGIAASLVNTMINYSISIGLGIAGTVESRVNNNGKNNLRGYRGAWYAGIVLSGIGVIISMLAIVHGHAQKQRQQKSEDTGIE